MPRLRRAGRWPDNSERRAVRSGRIQYGSWHHLGPASTYFDYHTRICRPVGLSPEDRQAVCDYAVERIGLQYDLKNIVDLGRYLVPLPVPQRFRRRMIALGSGDPTKLICSALIARAFAAIGYPILPAIEHVESASARRGNLSHSRQLTLLPARFRYFSIFCHHQANDRNGFRLQDDQLVYREAHLPEREILVGVA